MKMSPVGPKPSWVSEGKQRANLHGIFIGIKTLVPSVGLIVATSWPSKPYAIDFVKGLYGNNVQVSLLQPGLWWARQLFIWQAATFEAFFACFWAAEDGFVCGWILTNAVTIKPIVVAFKIYN